MDDFPELDMEIKNQENSGMKSNSYRILTLSHTQPNLEENSKHPIILRNSKINVVDPIFLLNVLRTMEKNSLNSRKAMP
jgi:hypothetical protein